MLTEKSGGARDAGDDRELYICLLAILGWMWMYDRNSREFFPDLQKRFFNYPRCTSIAQNLSLIPRHQSKRRKNSLQIPNFLPPQQRNLIFVRFTPGTGKKNESCSHATCFSYDQKSSTLHLKKQESTIQSPIPKTITRVNLYKVS